MPSKPSSVDLTIVIPTYNEAKAIGDTLDKLADYLKNYPLSVEVLIVDLHSPDNTAEVAQGYAKKFDKFHIIDAGSRPKGKFMKGKQVQMGMLAGKGRYVLFMDADLATPLKYLDSVRVLIEQRRPVGICVRDLDKSHKGVRKLISGFGNFLVQLLILPGIPDTQCGFKVFSHDAAQSVFPRQTISSWGFDMEILAIARQQGYPIELIHVPDWHNEEKGSKFGGSPLKAAIQTFPDILKIKWGMLRGKYKKASS